MSTYPPQAVENAANRLMSTLALHEDSRGTVTDYLADAYDAGGNNALRAAIPAATLDDLRAIREDAAAAINEPARRLAALHRIVATASRIADGLNQGRAEHVADSPDWWCAHHGEDGMDTDPEPWCHGCVEAGVTSAPAPAATSNADAAGWGDQR